MGGAAGLEMCCEDNIKLSGAGAGGEPGGARVECGREICEIRFGAGQGRHALLHPPGDKDVARIDSHFAQNCFGFAVAGQKT